MPGFSVVAIVAAYNEADVIAHVVGDLIQHGIDVYFLDDGSTDGTVAAVEPFIGKGVLAIERLSPPADSSSAPPPFDWERVLRRKNELARTLDAHWFIHHDADEFRESPWAGVSLHEGIRRVDAMGYNAIDFASLDFWPVDDRFQPGGDVRDALTLYSEREWYDRMQIRCWRKTDDVDLVSSGGHAAKFRDRRVFPVRFISRHYPIRSQAHGERKVHRERRHRFRQEELARGWHVQYAGADDGASFLRDPSTLQPYDPDAVRIKLTLQHRGVEELEGQLAAERATIDILRRDLNLRIQEIYRTVDLLTQTQKALAQAEEGVTRADEALQLREADNEALRAALKQRLDEIAQWQASLEDAMRRLDTMERSASWRWTAPWRAIVRLLRGF